MPPLRLLARSGLGRATSAVPSSEPSAASLPWPLAVLAAARAGALAGGLLGALPGWLKARFGAHEVINTIMLNFVVQALVLWLGRRWFFVDQTLHTPAITAAGDSYRAALDRVSIDDLGRAAEPLGALAGVTATADFTI